MCRALSLIRRGPTVAEAQSRAVEARATAVVAGMLTAAVVAVTAGPASAACDKFASPRGSNVVAKLANSLRPGQTGCLRAGVYRGRIKIRKGGRAGAPTTIRSAPGARATVRGRLWVAEQREPCRREGLYLDGRNGAKLPSPTVNGNRIVFRDNDITTRNTTICFVLGLRRVRPRGPHRDRTQPHPQLRPSCRPPTTITASMPRPRTARASPTTGSTTTRIAACSCSRMRSAPTSPAT